MAIFAESIESVVKTLNSDLKDLRARATSTVPFKDASFFMFNSDQTKYHYNYILEVMIKLQLVRGKHMKNSIAETVEYLFVTTSTFLDNMIEKKIELEPNNKMEFDNAKSFEDTTSCSKSDIPPSSIFVSSKTWMFLLQQ